MFKRHAGAILLDGVRAVPAVLFYLGYIAGLVTLVSWPAFRADQPGQALWQGAVLGAMAYGTYELTNLATLRAWNWSMVAVDLAWGTVLTAVAAWAGVWVARTLAG